jgi:hypothetical protein
MFFSLYLLQFLLVVNYFSRMIRHRESGWILRFTIGGLVLMKIRNLTLPTGCDLRATLVNYPLVSDSLSETSRSCFRRWVLHCYSKERSFITSTRFCLFTSSGFSSSLNFIIWHNRLFNLIATIHENFLIHNANWWGRVFPMTKVRQRSRYVSTINFYLALKHVLHTCRIVD